MPRGHGPFFVVDAAGTTLPVSPSSSSATGMSDPSSTFDTASETPQVAFGKSPHRGSGSMAKQKGAAKGNRSSKHRRYQRHMFDVNHSPTRDSSSGIGPSRRQNDTQHTNRQERNKNPVRHDTSTFLPRQQSTYTIPPGPYYNNGPQLVPYERYNPFGPSGYAVPTPMPTNVPPTVPFQMQPSMPAPPQPQPAAPLHQTASPETEELKRLKKVLEEESSKRMAQEEQRRRDALEQEMKKEANETAMKNVMDMKHAEEEANREIEEVKREAYKAALETFEAEEQRRRRLEEEIEQCRRIAREKVEAEMLLEAEKKQRAEEEKFRIVREAEAKVAREMEERRRLRQEEEDRTAQIRQEVEERVRAQILEEQATHLVSSRESGSLSSCSSKHGGRSSSSTTSSSKLTRLNRLLQNPDKEMPEVWNSDITPGFSRDPFIYFQGQSTAPPSLADEEPAMKEPCCKCGRIARDQSPEILASRIREKGLSYGDSGTVLAQRGRTRSLSPASRSKAGSGEISNSESSEDEWSSASTISTVSILREGSSLGKAHLKSMMAANCDNDVHPKMRTQANLERNNSTLTSKPGKRSLEADMEHGSDYNFEAPGRLTGNSESPKPTTSSGVFQYLVTDESSEDDIVDDHFMKDEDDEDEENWEDDDSAEGGTTLTSHNRQEASNNLNHSTSDEAGKGHNAERQHEETETSQAQALSSQESRLLLVLAKHINDSRKASQYNNFVDVGSPSQDWRRGQITGSYTTSHPVASGYSLDWSAEFMPYFISPNATIGGQRKWHDDEPRRSQVTRGPTLESTSSLLASEYRQMAPIALIPCIVLPGNTVQSFLQVPISRGNENTIRP